MACADHHSLDSHGSLTRKNRATLPADAPVDIDPYRGIPLFFTLAAFFKKRFLCISPTSKCDSVTSQYPCGSEPLFENVTRYACHDHENRVSANVHASCHAVTFQNRGDGELRVKNGPREGSFRGRLNDKLWRPYQFTDRKIGLPLKTSHREGR